MPSRRTSIASQNPPVSFANTTSKSPPVAHRAVRSCVGDIRQVPPMCRTMPYVIPTQSGASQVYQPIFELMATKP